MHRQAILFIAEDVESEALAHPRRRTDPGTLKCVAVKAPVTATGARPLLEDIAILQAGKSSPRSSDQFESLES